MLEINDSFDRLPRMRESVQNRAIVLLLIINLIGGLLVPSLAAAFGSESRVLLCTSQGYQWVSIETEQELNLTGSDSLSKHCFLCLNSHDSYEQPGSSYDYLAIRLFKRLLLEGLKYTDYQNFITNSQRTRSPPIFL